MSRVCALWRLLYRHYLNHRHIVFDAGTMWDKKPHTLSQHCANFAVISETEDYAEFLAYKLGAMLDSMCTSRMQTLTLMESIHCFCDDYDLITLVTTTESVLASKGIRIPVVLVKNTDRDTAFQSRFLNIDHHHPSEEWECCGLSKITTVCKKLVLINLSARHFITQAAIQMLDWDAASVLPQSEKALMRGNYSSGTECPVTIPCLRFRPVETPTEQARSLLVAANDHCPAVSQRVFEKVTTIYARWVNTLAYPEDWSCIRVFLQLFNTFSPGDLPQRWDSVDLRKLELADLTHVTFAALDGCFQD
ncbi:uncharacterized protein LOC129600298 isoform X2 [Paramacrobiotus metropolitanus]|nr:uncharacterized protein LOC129600298 isoform X2 [Paramacrobiotus metropolitanus]